MNTIDQALSRLFKAAARAPRPAVDPVPFGLESRILAQWRSIRPDEDFLLLVGLARRAMICAGLVMIMCIAWGLRGHVTLSSGAVALANYEINTHLPP